MTRKEITKKLVEVLPTEFFKRDSQLSFDFVSPSHVGINKADEYVRAVIDILKHTLMHNKSNSHGIN